MKKLGRIFLICLIIAVVAITAVACVSKDDQGRIILKTPKVELSGNTISWNPIKFAAEYGVTVNEDAEVTTKATNYPLMQYDGVVKVKVRAIGDGTKYAGSKESNVVTYEPKLGLKSPEGVTIFPQEGGALKITWKAVDNATSYNINVTHGGTTFGDNISVNELEKTFPAEFFTKAGEYKFAIKAIGNADYGISTATSVSYIVKKNLANPKTVILTTTTSAATISMKKVENADKYYVRALKDGVVYQTLENPSINSDDVSLNLNKFTLSEAGMYTFEVKAGRQASGSAFYNDSEWVKVNLKKDETKLAEMKKHPAPANFKLDGTTLSWDAVDGAVQYRVQYNIYKDTDSGYNTSTDKLTVDLSKEDNLTGSNLGGKACFMDVFVAENMEGGIIKGVSTAAAIPYQSYEKPTLEGDTYIIDSLIKLAYINQEPTAKYKLTKDIDAGNSLIFPFVDSIAADGTTDKSFSGSFDGGGFTINKFVLQPRPGSKQVSLFGNISAGASVKNLALLDASIAVEGSKYQLTKDINAALIANTNKGTIDNIVISGGDKFVETEGEFAGVVNLNEGVVSNCSVKINAKGRDIGGGIVGNNKGSIFNATLYASTVDVSSVQSVGVAATTPVNAHAGGIAAINTGTIESCGVSENSIITANAQGTDHNSYAGGIAGISHGGKIISCYNQRTADKYDTGTSSRANGRTAMAYGGGIVGYADNTAISKVYNMFAGVITNGIAGGIIGHMTATTTLDNAYSLSRHIIGERRGGFIGVALGTVTNSYYANYYVPVGNGLKPSSTGDIANLNLVTRGEDMKTLPIEGFRITTAINANYMILTDVAYLCPAVDGSTFTFTNAVATKNEARKKFGNFYIGDQVIETPTTPARIDLTGKRFDQYTIEHNGKTYVMARVVEVKV